jgi:hypothetical protein
MTNGPIRRPQLITTFSPGSLTIDKNGKSLIICGLDYWYNRDDDGRCPADVEVNEFAIDEWRLSKKFGIDLFLEPPDYRVRRGRGSASDVANLRLTIPVLRFPSWHKCNFCKHISPKGIFSMGAALCNNSKCKGNSAGKRMSPIFFVSICKGGHMQDLPWRELACGPNPRCGGEGEIRFIDPGKGLSNMCIQCDKCKEQIYLSNLTSVKKNSVTHEIESSGLATLISKRRDCDPSAIKCPCHRPWHGEIEEGWKYSMGECDHTPIACFINASNLHFPKSFASIYVPKQSDEFTAQSENLVHRLVGIVREDRYFETILRRVSNMDPDSGVLKLEDYIKNQEAIGDDVKALDRNMLEKAIEIFLDPRPTLLHKASEPLMDEDPEIEFRRLEFDLLREGIDQADLAIEVLGGLPDLDDYFSCISRVTKLRHTRIQLGFDRIDSTPLAAPPITAKDAAVKLLYKRKPKEEVEFLPASVVYGEGIFIELKEDKIKSWLANSTLIEHISPLYQKLGRLVVPESPPSTGPQWLARMALVHTLSHAIINQAVFECGYSAASLSERLYISSDPRAPMAGVLIYTAAGDSEGTLGGLVELASDERRIEGLLRRAIDSCQWCSADPICSEASNRGGQGPHSQNFAACHGCVLIPETACECFNTLLDRTLVTGNPENPTLGFFK